MTRRSLAVVSTLGLVVALQPLGVVTAEAHGPSRQKVVETVDINKSPDDVWNIVKDFGGIAKWLPIISSSPADHGNDVGSVRTLAVKAPGSPQVIEELVAYTPAEHSYEYKINKVDPKVLPVNNYTSWITVSANPAGGSTVEWKGAFYRSFMLNDPPPDENDAAAVKGVRGIYRAGLDNLKKIAEGGK